METPGLWPQLAVGTRVSVLVVALVFVFGEVTSTWLGVALSLGAAALMLLTVIRITLFDMVKPNWHSRRPTAFLSLLFINLLEAVLATAAVMGGVERITETNAFDPPIDSLGVALLSALGPFGGTPHRPVTGWGEVSMIASVVLLLFMTVVVIAAGVNGYVRSRETEER